MKGPTKSGMQRAERGRELGRRDAPTSVGEEPKKKDVADTAPGQVRGYTRRNPTTGEVQYVRPYHKIIPGFRKTEGRVSRLGVQKTSPVNNMTRLLKEALGAKRMPKGQVSEDGKSARYPDFDVMIGRDRAMHLGISPDDAPKLQGAIAKVKVHYDRGGQRMATLSARIPIKRAHPQDDGVSIHFDEFQVPLVARKLAASQDSAPVPADGMAKLAAKVAPTIEVVGVEL